MTVEQAINCVERILLNAWKDAPEYGKVRLYTWGGGIGGTEYDGDTPSSGLARHPAVGFRVAEVSFEAMDPATGRGGGSTFMQVDPGAAEVCFFAERCVIARIEEWEPEEVMAEDWRLLASAFDDDTASKYLAEQEVAS